MRNIEKPGVCNEHSYFSYLPDEIVLLILNKIIDLKTLCRCKLVSTRFNLIDHRVHTISFVASKPSYDANPSSDAKKLLHFLSNPFHLFAPSGHRVPTSSFRSAIQSMSKFTRLKSLCIEFPATRKDVDNGCDLYKWKVEFGRKIESLVFLSPNSVCDMKGFDGNGQLEEVEKKNNKKNNRYLQMRKCHLAFDCLRDAAVRFSMLLGCTNNFPLLEKVLIKQSGNRGSVSLSGKNIVEMRKWLHSPTDSLERKMSGSMDLPRSRCRCYAPLLKLPISGYLMKGVTLIMFQSKGDDSFFMNINLNDFEDKEEAAYGEAVMEMLKILRGQVKKA